MLAIGEPTLKYKSYCNIKGDIMKKYACPCGYVYDPAKGDPKHGVAPGTAWENLPEDWVCPVCGLGKEVFDEE